MDTYRKSDTSQPRRKISLQDLPREVLLQIFELAVKRSLILPNYSDEPIRLVRDEVCLCQPEPSHTLRGWFSQTGMWKASKLNELPHMLAETQKLLLGSSRRVDEDNKIARKTDLLSLALTCQAFKDLALHAIYSENVFDLRLFAVESPNPLTYGTLLGTASYFRSGDASFPRMLSRPSFKHITSLHLSTRLIKETTKTLNRIPQPCLFNVKYVRISCAHHIATHTPSESVRAHIRSGDRWVRFWSAITDKFMCDRFPRFINIDVDICGWRVPPGWRSLVLAPIRLAATAHRCRERKQKALAHRRRAGGHHPESNADITDADIWAWEPEIPKRITVTVPWDAESVAKIAQPHLFPDARESVPDFDLRVNEVAIDAQRCLESCSAETRPPGE